MLEYQGKKYARVSEILFSFNDFSKIDPQVLARKAIIGTNVHAAINDELDSIFPCLKEEEIGYFNSFMKWKSLVNPHFVERETRHYHHEKKITGAIDALVKFREADRPILVDFKTSAQESPIVWPMQAHLYAYLLKESGRTIADVYLFIKLDKDGNAPKVFLYKYEDQIMQKCLREVDDFWKKVDKDIA